MPMQFHIIIKKEDKIMANQVTNKITLQGSEQTKNNEAFAFLKGANGDIDFNKIIPMPLELIHIQSGSREDTAWACYQAKALENFKDIDKMLAWAWVIEAGIKTRDQLVDYFAKKYEEEEKTWPEEYKTGFETIFEYGKYLFEIYQKYGYRNGIKWAIENWECKWNAFNISREGNTIKFDTVNTYVINLMLTVSEKFPEVEFLYETCDEERYFVGRYALKAGEIVSELEPEEGTEEEKEIYIKVWGHEPEFVEF